MKTFIFQENLTVVIFLIFETYVYKYSIVWVFHESVNEILVISIIFSKNRNELLIWFMLYMKNKILFSISFNNFILNYLRFKIFEKLNCLILFNGYLRMIPSQLANIYYYKNDVFKSYFLFNIFNIPFIES